MKKFIFLLFTLTSSLLSFAQGSITYELNGGITNDFGWQNKQDMYETLNADWNAYSGTSTTWKTLVELNGDVAAGIPNQAGAMNLTFLENEGFKLHFSWLITYMDATCTTQGVTLCSSNASYLRYNLAAFFLNTQRTSWPKTADYTLAGDVKYFQPTWKGGFCGPTEYAKGEVVTLPIPYKEGKTFAGWYKKADFSGDKITVISGSGDITLYAKWVEYIPNIAEVIAMVDGTTTTVQGIVTYVEGDNFWIQDDTGGLFCYGKENNVKEGELVTISGNKTTYYGSAKLENAIVIEQTTTNILEPQTLLLSTINTNKTDYLNELIYLEGVTISRFESENKTLYLTDGLNEIALYNWDGITEDKFPVGSKVSVKAVLSIHDTTLQLRGKEAWLVTATAVGKDNYEYPEVETDGYKFNLTNNWLYSVNLNNWSENRPNPLAEGSRSVVEKDGILYFSYRDNNNPIEQPRLVCIDAQTGKMLNPIFFADYIFKDVNGNWLFGPYTDLKLDNEGNAITSNLPISGGAFQIWNVDLETGEGRLIVDLATDSTKWLSAQFPENTTIRLDRIGVYGDINGDATIMSVVSSGADVYYWTIKDGKWDGETNWIKLGLGEGVNVGGAPVICPIEGDYFYVDGFTTHPLLFDPDGNLVDAFDEAHEANHLMLGTKGVQRGKSHNGVTEFEVNGEYYLLCAGDNTNGNATAPSTFVLYKFADEYRAFKDITPLYEFPMAGMGGATNPQRVATSFARPNKEGTSIDIYVFTAENGYGKYTLSLEKINDIIASGICGDNLTWKLTKDGVLTISGTGKMYNYNYNSSDQPWNSYKQQIKTININDGVTSIGNWAFEGCSSLTSITIGNSVTYIREGAFYYCSSLTSITIPNRVTSIGQEAFGICSSLTSITIPNSVTYIGSLAFTNCSSLTSIEVNANNLNYASIDGVLYNKDVTTLICCPGGKTFITIPNSVTSIGNSAFNGCSSLTSITIPNSVTSIGNDAFSTCSSLTSITIPNSVTSIGGGAFRDCSSLTSITIPNRVTSIGNSAFSYCSGLTSINIEATIPPTIGGAYTFINVFKNIPVTVPCGSLSAYQSANYWSEFTNYVEEFPYTFSATTADATMGSVTIETAPACGVDAVIKATPNAGYRFVKWSDGNTNAIRTITVTEDITLTAEFANDIIASGTCGDNLTWKLTFDSVLTISGTGVMYDYNYNLSDQPWNSYKSTIKSVVIEDGATSIGNYAFYYCYALTSITIPNSVTSIGSSAFSDCSSLTSISIPNSVTSIGESAFSGCSSLTSIHVEANNQNYVSIDGVLYDKDITTLICCPSGKTSITIPNSVTSIGDYAFSGCKSLKSITIPNSVTSIGDYAFYGCLSLNTIKCLGFTPPSANDLGADIENCTLKVPSEAYNNYLQHAYWGQFLDKELLIKTNPTIINKGYNGEIIILYNPFAGNEGMIDAMECYAHTGLITMESNSYSDWKYCHSGWRAGEDKYKMTKEGDFWKLVIPNIYEYYKCPESEEIIKLAFVFNDGPNGYKEGKTANGSDILINLVESTIEQYEIIVISNENGNIIGGGFYNENEEVILTANPNEGYRFTQWSDGNTDNPRTITVTEDITLTAEFVNDIIASGTCGDNLTWKLTFDSVLTISGTGAMYDYNSSSQPWDSYKQQIKTININDGVTSIGSSAFEDCSYLTSITIPNSVTSIGNSAFYSCSSLTSVTIPNSVTTIGVDAFSGCSKITEVHISNLAKWCDINFSYPSSNPLYRKIAHLYVNNSKITDLVIPEGVDSIKNNAFYGYALLNSVTIPNSITTIGNSAFQGCSGLTSVTIPNSVTTIGNQAFQGCFGLTSVTIPNSVTSIGEFAFSQCSSLASITIPNSVTSIGGYAFVDCSSLTSINIEATIPPTIGGANTFNNVSKNISVTVPCGSLSAYQSANYWSEFTNFRESFPYTFSATTADATMGSVTIETAPACGVDAVIKATPNAGYRFVKWSDGNTNATRSIVVNEDMTLSATFEKIPTFTINVTANAQMGSATGGGTFETGKSITLSAIANEGYRFVKWSDGITTNPRTITVTQNISLVAIFEALYVNWYPDNNDEHSFLGKHYYDTVTITAGKTLIIEDKATIACNDIVIKADKNGNVPDIKVVGDIIANNGVTYEWQIDDTRWYFFSLPFNCKIQDIKLSTIANGPNDGVWNYYNPNNGSGDFIIRKYNQKNASNGQGKKTGWEDCKGNEMLHKGRGYIIGLFPSGSKAKAMFKSEKQELLSKLIEQELDFGDDHSWFDYQAGDNALYNGWNLVGIPYFEAFSQGELDAAYVSIPNSDGVTYKQYTLSEALSKGLLRPFMSFFIQLGENRAPIFSPNDRSNAPMLREKANSVADEIIVKVHSAEDEELTDKTTIINNVALTAEYEIGHDLQKMIGYAEHPQIYTIEECGILAFNAQDVSSRMTIRLGVYAPVNGEYVIGGEAWGDMADVMLYDNETYRSTSLIIPQTIYLEKGVHDERFEIRVQSSSIPTGVDDEMSDLEVMIEEGRLYVENVPANSVLYIYDMNGKLVHQQRTDTAIDYEFYAQGIYNITICTDNNKVFNTKIVY